MSRGVIPVEQFGECHGDGCDTVALWDMAAIGINAKHVFCSPDCAHEFIEKAEVPVEVVSLHDPQYCADRPDGVDDDCITIWREVENDGVASYTVWQLKAMFDAPFRPE